MALCRHLHRKTRGRRPLVPQGVGPTYHHCEERRLRMIRTYRTLLRLCLVSAVFWGLMGSAAAQEPANHSGTITLTATSAALGVGWSWGHGTLTLLNGKQYRFKVEGLDVVAVGFKQATGVGNVYNLKNIKDFAGTYVAATASGTVGGGMGASSMRNDKGVVINLSGVGQGVDFRLAVSGMTVKLVK
jgi:hypothetical protein